MARGARLILYDVLIEALAAEGKSLAHVAQGVLFVPGCVPGDRVDVRVVRRRKGYLEGVIERLVMPSPLRQQPVCAHFGVCGGCQWQLLPYTQQLSMKQEQVADQLQRIGHVQPGRMRPILPASPTLYYRNKLEFTFGPRGWQVQPKEGGELLPMEPALGFHVPGRFDRVLDIEHCHLQPEPSNAIRNAIRDFSLARGYSFYDAKTLTGWLRGMMIRTTRLGQTMLLIIFAYEDAPARAELMGYVAEQFPQIDSLLWCVNGKVNDTIYDIPVELHRGRAYIEERLGPLTIAIGPKSFYQTNSRQGERLYGVVRRMAGLTGRETVYDLYCGTGTIGLFLAHEAARVVGVESVPEAVTDAWRNAERNGIGNATFVAGDVLRVVDADFTHRHGAPDVVVTDPPRAGMHPDVVEKLLALAAPRVVYVSCNPATQARDLAMLAERYEVAEAQGVDMFPHTKHVESVVRLELRH